MGEKGKDDINNAAGAGPNKTPPTPKASKALPMMKASKTAAPKATKATTVTRAKTEKALPTAKAALKMTRAKKTTATAARSKKKVLLKPTISDSDKEAEQPEVVEVEDLSYDGMVREAYAQGTSHLFNVRISCSS